jgi:hypothetical protein
MSNPANKGTPADKAKSGTVQGEGDYVAGRRYDKSQGDFVKSGEVEQHRGEAAPHDSAEASDMQEAEQRGKSHSKGEAPGDLKGKKPTRP